MRLINQKIYAFNFHLRAEFEIDGVWQVLWKDGSACRLVGWFAGWDRHIEQRRMAGQKKQKWECLRAERLKSLAG